MTDRSDRLEAAIAPLRDPATGKVALWVDRSELASLVTGRASLSAPERIDRQIEPFLPAVSQPRYVGTVRAPESVEGMAGARAVMDGFGDHQALRRLWLDEPRARAIAAASPEAAEGLLQALGTSASRESDVSRLREARLGPVRQASGRGGREGR